MGRAPSRHGSASDLNYADEGPFPFDSFIFFAYTATVETGCSMCHGYRWDKRSAEEEQRSAGSWSINIGPLVPKFV